MRGAAAGRGDVKQVSGAGEMMLGARWVGDGGGSFTQEVEWCRWSGIDEPPETRKKDKERRRKRKVLNRKNSESFGAGNGGIKEGCLGV